MFTVRQIERHWESKAYERLFAELVAARPEASLRLGIDIARPVPAAALAVVRLDELTQSHAKLYPKLIKTVVAAQEADGGWGDLVTTALCLRALLCGQGNGPSIDRGMKYLADLQKSEGIWPNVPIRRMPAEGVGQNRIVDVHDGGDRKRESPNAQVAGQLGRIVDAAAA